MKRALMTGAALALMTIAAQADPIFDTTKQFTVNGTNSPDSFSQPGNTGGASLLDGGTLLLTTTFVPTGGANQAEWIVFHYQTTDGQRLSQANENWSLNQLGVPTLVATNFIADFTQWTDTAGNLLNQPSEIFHQTPMSNPVPGGLGNGEGTLGFLAPFPAGALPNLGAFTDPFSQVTNVLGTLEVGGFTQALEFEPQTPITGGVPEPSTWAMGIMGFGFVGLMGLRGRKSLAGTVHAKAL